MQDRSLPNASSIIILMENAKIKDGCTAALVFFFSLLRFNWITKIEEKESKNPGTRNEGEESNPHAFLSLSLYPALGGHSSLSVFFPLLT